MTRQKHDNYAPFEWDVSIEFAFPNYQFALNTVHRFKQLHDAFFGGSCVLVKKVTDSMFASWLKAKEPEIKDPKDTRPDIQGPRSCCALHVRLTWVRRASDLRPRTRALTLRPNDNTLPMGKQRDALHDAPGVYRTLNC